MDEDTRRLFEGDSAFEDSGSESEEDERKPCLSKQHNVSISDIVEFGSNEGVDESELINIEGMIINIEDPRETKNGHNVLNCLIVDENQKRLKFVVWDEQICHFMEIIRPGVMAKIERVKIQKITKQGLKYSHGDGFYELVMEENSKISILANPNYTQMKFAKIDELKEEKIYNFINLKGKVASITSKTAQKNKSTKWMILVVKNGKSTIEVNFWNELEEKIKNVKKGDNLLLINFQLTKYNYRTLTATTLSKIVKL